MNRTFMIVPALVIALGAMLGVADTTAGEWKTLDDHRWCRDGNWDADYCEVREITLKANRDVIGVDGGANGGISVEGWDRDEIKVLAKITVWTRDDDEVEEVVRKIKIETDGDFIHAEGPKQRRREGWSVSYRLMVPRKSNLELETTNGGIGVSDVEGKMRLEATNGGLSLANLGGDVRARTTNGGLSVELSGSEWHGKGLDARTTNGGVTMAIPDGYNAELETGTVNGGIHVDFPIMVRGKIDKKIHTTLGDGGAPISIRTTNGGVRIERL